MKTLPLAALLLVAGLGIGSGSAFGTAFLLKSADPPAKAATPAPPEAPNFVPTGLILSPLVSPTGRLAGYVQFEAMLQTAPDQAEFVKARLPLLMHAINMRTYRTPMTSGPDGLLPNLETFRALVMASAAEAFGPGLVKRVAIQKAIPA